MTYITNNFLLNHNSFQIIGHNHSSQSSHIHQNWQQMDKHGIQLFNISNRSNIGTLKGQCKQFRIGDHHAKPGLSVSQTTTQNRSNCWSMQIYTTRKEIQKITLKRKVVFCEFSIKIICHWNHRHMKMIKMKQSADAKRLSPLCLRMFLWPDHDALAIGSSFLHTKDVIGSVTLCRSPRSEKRLQA